MDNRKKLVCGVGLNDASYSVLVREELPKVDGKRNRRVVWECPFYKRWTSMLARCYRKSDLGRRTTYHNCSVCDDWLIFTNFKAWMEEQDWEGMYLDKDVILPGNRVYSPETCAFVSAKVNQFVVESNAIRGKYLIGVHRSKRSDKFMAFRSEGNVNKYIGSYDTELEAHQAWLACKLELAKKLAAEQTDPRVAEALIRRYENYSAEGET